VIGERRVLVEDVVKELSNSLALALLAGPCPWLAGPYTVLWNHTLAAFRRTSSLAIRIHTSASRAGTPTWLARRHFDRPAGAAHRWGDRGVHAAEEESEVWAAFNLDQRPKLVNLQASLFLCFVVELVGKSCEVVANILAHGDPDGLALT